MKKKGFTLIELIAVIIVLGIVLTLMFPVVDGVISKSEKNTLRTSVNNLSRVISQQCNEEKMNGEEITTVYKIRNNAIDDEDIQATNLPKEANISVSADCSVDISMVEGDYCVLKSGSNVTINNNIYHCGAQYIDISETDESCFIFDEATRTITGYDYSNKSCPSEVSIPATIDGIPVEHIGDLAFYDQDNLVLLAAGIDESVMYDDEFLYSVNSGGGVSNIYLLGDIVDNIEKVGFEIISASAYIINNNNIVKECYYDSNDYTKYDEKPLDYVISDTDTYIGCSVYFSSYELGVDYDFVDTSPGLSAVDFSKATNLKSIGYLAFGDNSIETLNFETLPNLEKINVGAFQNNLIEGSVNLLGLKGLTEISNSLFCLNSITDVVFPDNIISIGYNAFANNSLEYVGFNNGLENIKIGAFTANNISKVSLPNTLVNLSGFMYNNISEINIPNSVRSIDYSAFFINQITSLYIPESVINISAMAFMQNRISILTLNEGLKEIGAGAFGDNRISSLEIPSSVEKISYSAFYLSGINKLTLNEGLKDIKRFAFACNQIESVTIPNSVTSIGIGAFNDNQLQGDEAFIYARTTTGAINNKTLVSYGGAKRANVVIPSTITTIGAHAFVNTKLESVEIPNSVTAIGDYAFYENQLTNVEIPNGVKTIGDYAFQYNQLESVILPNTVIAVDKWAFSYNKIANLVISNKLTLLDKGVFAYNSLTTVTVPDGVVWMGEDVFRNNKLETVVIGNTTKTIGGACFANNPTLKHVTIGSAMFGIIWNAFSGADGVVIDIDRAEGTITEAPWRAKNATINWNGES